MYSVGLIISRTRYSRLGGSNYVNLWGLGYRVSNSNYGYSLVVVMIQARTRGRQLTLLRLGRSDRSGSRGCGGGLCLVMIYWRLLWR